MLLQKKLLRIIFLILLMVIPKTYADDCQDFKDQISKDPAYKYGVELLPADWSKTSTGDKVKVFWWKRKGTNPNLPPLLMVHGGPGGNSWWFPSFFPRVFADYPGDIFSIDERGDGCSSDQFQNLPYKHYERYSSRNIVRDLEKLRQKFYPTQKWRAFGQSHGSIILHYYLEMFPEGLESVHAHGFAFLEGKRMMKYPELRHNAMINVANLFLEEYPETKIHIQKVKDSLSEDDCFHALVPDSTFDKLCGPSVVDSISSDLGFRYYWKTVAKIFAKMINPDGTVNKTERDLFYKDSIGYGLGVNYFNLIMGVLGQEVNFSDPALMRKLNSESSNNIISETRFFTDTILSQDGANFTTNIDPLDFTKIKTFLENNPNFNFYLYSGALDPFAPPELFVDEVRIFGDLVKYTNFPNTGHDGNSTEPLIQDRMLSF